MLNLLENLFFHNMTWKILETLHFMIETALEETTPTFIVIKDYEIFQKRIS